MPSLAYAQPFPPEPEPGSDSESTSAASIPAPEHNTIAKLAIYALEILQGTRSLAQLNNTVSAEVVEQLLARRALWAERRTVYRDHRRAVPWPGRVRVSRPFPHIAEAVVVVYTEVRALAVAIRLEYFRGRWRATDLTVL